MIQHSVDDDGFPYSDWSAPYRTPAGRDAVLAAHGERFDLPRGRRPYDPWSGYRPKAPGGPMTERLNAATKFVATTSRTVSTGARPRAWGRISSKARAFALVGTQTFASGVIFNTYRAAGALQAGLLRRRAFRHIGLARRAHGPDAHCTIRT